MECSQAQLLISREIDGELADEARLPLEQHLAQCDECAAYARQCRGLQGLIDSRSLAPERPDGHRAMPPPVAVPLGRGGGLSRLAALLLAAAGLALFGLWLGERSGAARLRAELARQRAVQPAALVQPGLAMSLDHDAVVPAEYAGAFLALGDYFQGDMRWVAIDGEQMELGVASHPGLTQAVDQGDAAAVNVRVVTSGPGQSRAISSPIVLLRSGAQAEFRFAEVEGGQGRELAYRCAYPGGPDGFAAVGVTIQGGPAGRPVYLWGAVRTDDDGSAPAAYARVGETRYMLFLAARPLAERNEQGKQA